MKVVVQRVQQAAVHVHDEAIASINQGLLVLVGIKQGDTKADIDWMIQKLLKMRIFDDEDGNMNDSVTDIGGGVLLVPNFTLYGDASKGNRPGFSAAESPDKARKLYSYMVEKMEASTDLPVESGKFGAYMDVSLTNDGPVTIVLESNS